MSLIFPIFTSITPKCSQGVSTVTKNYASTAVSFVEETVLFLHCVLLLVLRRFHTFEIPWRFHDIFSMSCRQGFWWAVFTSFKISSFRPPHVMTVPLLAEITALMGLPRPFWAPTSALDKGAFHELTKSQLFWSTAGLSKQLSWPMGPWATNLSRQWEPVYVTFFFWNMLYCMTWPWTNTAGASKAKGRVQQIFYKFSAIRMSWKKRISVAAIRFQQLHGNSCVVRSGPSWRRPFSIRTLQREKWLKVFECFFGQCVLNTVQYFSHLEHFSKFRVKVIFLGSCCMMTWPFTKHLQVLPKPRGGRSRSSRSPGARAWLGFCGFRGVSSDPGSCMEWQHSQWRLAEASALMGYPGGGSAEDLRRDLANQLSQLRQSFSDNIHLGLKAGDMIHLGGERRLEWFWMLFDVTQTSLFIVCTEELSTFSGLRQNSSFRVFHVC